MAASSGMEYFEIDVEASMGHFSRPSNADVVEEDETELVWAAIERLPSMKRHNFAIVRRDSVSSPRGRRSGAVDSAPFEVVDVRKLDRHGRERVLKKALATNEQDNYNLLAGIKSRFDR